jgi:hypothetical protein
MISRSLAPSSASLDAPAFRSPCAEQCGNPASSHHLRNRLPNPTLIEERCRELGLRRSEIASRCGYQNLSKGVRRLEQVLAGHFERADALLRGLPNALSLSPDVVQEAIDKTVRQIAAEQDALWRAAFQPGAYLLGTTERPSQIFFFGITGGPERWLKIPLDLSQTPVSYAAQALAVVRKTPEVKFFGRTTGFIINYTPDHAVRFDIEGRPVETLTSAYRPGEVSVALGRRPVSAEAFGKTLGTWPT